MGSSLKRQYRLWTTLLVAVPCVILSAIYASILFQAVKEDGKQLIRQRTEAKQRLIDQWVQERFVTVKEMSEHEAVRSLDLARMEQAFSTKQRYDANYDSLSFIDKHGVFQKSTLPGGIRFRSVADRPFFRKAMDGEDHISEVVLGRNSGRLIINFSSPVKDSAGEIQGLVLGSIRTSTLTDLLRSSWEGKTGQTVLINKEGLILTEPRQSAELRARGLVWDATASKLKASSGLFSQIRRGESGLIAWTDLLGRKVIGYYIDVPERGWTIVGRIDESEIMAPAYKQLSMIAVGLILLLICVFPLSYKIDQTLKALDENAARFEAMMTQSKEAIILSEVDTGRIVEVNDAAATMFGYAKTELLSMSVAAMEITGEKDRDEDALNISNHSNTVSRRRKDGSVILIEHTASRIQYLNTEMTLSSYRQLSEARKLQEKVEKDIRLAGSIQRKLRQPDFRNNQATLRTLYYPSQYVSGDQYGYQWSADGTILSGYVLDVSGHGFATAIQTAAISTLCNTLMAEEKAWSLAAVAKLNLQIMSYLSEESFASIFVFSLDTWQQSLTCITGGINRFLVSTPMHNGWITLPGSYLGIDGKPQFEQMTFPLHPGDCFYLLTDGITDRLDLSAPIDASDFESTVHMLNQLAADGEKKDDSSGICIQYHG